MSEEKKELLLVISKVREALKKEGFSVSLEAIKLLSDQTLEVLKKAGEEARRNKRKVIKERDILKIQRADQ